MHVYTLQTIDFYFMLRINIVDSYIIYQITEFIYTGSFHGRWRQVVLFQLHYIHYILVLSVCDLESWNFN